jgi:hypothetical protein
MSPLRTAQASRFKPVQAEPVHTSGNQQANAATEHNPTKEKLAVNLVC